MSLIVSLPGLLDRLRRNDPANTRVFIPLGDFRNDNDVVAVAQLLRANEYANDLCFSCYRCSEVLDLNWDPLVQEIETRQELQNVTVECTPVGRLLPLFLEGFYQSLQRNSNLQSLQLSHIYFSSDDSAGLVSFLDESPSLRFLSFIECSMESGDAANSIAASLQRNSRIQVLHLVGCEADFVSPILQSLASSKSASTLKTLLYEPWGYDWKVEEADAEALQDYLESTTATIQCFTLSGIGLSRLPENSNILQSLSRNRSISEVTAPSENSPNPL